MTFEPDAGICSICRHSGIVISARGSHFFLCELAKSDPAYRKYPTLPVHTCPGFEPAPASSEDLTHRPMRQPRV